MSEAIRYQPRWVAHGPYEPGQPCFYRNRPTDTIAANLHGHVRCLPAVVLTQLQMVLISQPDQVLAAFLQQAAVGGMRDGFGHHCGVDDDFVQAAFFDQAGRTSRFDGDGEQDLNAFFTNAFPPAA